MHLFLILLACSGGSSDSAPATKTTGTDTDAGTGTDTGPNADTVTANGLRTLDSCVTSIDSDVPAFFATFFRCVTITRDGDSTLFQANGLPPHKSPYYPSDDPNWEEFDTSTGHFPNPSELSEQSLLLRVVDDPVSRGLAITTDLVDGEAGGTDEYHTERTDGTSGMGLDGVAFFTGTAAPGDLLTEEEQTFDQHSGHPQDTGVYHHHGTNAPALAVVAAAGYTTSTEPGSATVEVYGVMCDGTIVLGCPEMDGATPSSSDFDAQNGHVHDLESADGTVWFTERYHIHACGNGTVPVRTYAPEIQYYELCNRM